MVYQEEADLVELSIPGAKSSGARSVPHSCRATVILNGGYLRALLSTMAAIWSENRITKEDV